MSKLKVLSLQAFYGGSHRAFVDGWSRSSRHSWTTLSLPDRHWKWRMRHSAIHFSDEIRRIPANQSDWDVVFCTDMLNVAEFKGLVDLQIARIPIVVYFHENQFAYPQLSPQPRDLHFAFTNLTSALAADDVWFNSEFNRSSMLDKYSDVKKHWPDFRPKNIELTILAKSQIQSPGIDVPNVKRLAKSASEPLHLVWAARWEHDKNPDDLFEALCLIENRMDFRLSVIGQSYSKFPDAFEKIKDRFSDRIVHWGYQKSREDYFDVLAKADVFISTASHEFFGLAAAEAIAAGLFPLLPTRLAYPELVMVDDFPDNQRLLFGNSANELAERLVKLDRSEIDEWRIESSTFINKFKQTMSWKNRADAMDDALAAIAPG